MLIRDAVQADLAAVADLRVAAYRAGDHLAENSTYEPRLRSLGADGNGEILVAVQTVTGGPGGRAGPDQVADTIVGTVMLQPWPYAGHIVTSPDEAEIRALAVSPPAQGTGIGRELLRAVTERARLRAVRELLLLTQPDMLIAQRMYERAGFRRLPERDWSPDPEFFFLAYGLVLADVG